MKKILLGTTALVSLFAATAFAEAPVVTVGGSYDFQAGIADQDSAYETGASSREAKFSNDTRVNVKAQGKADNGLVYGAVVELMADVSSPNDNAGVDSDNTYLFLESSFGKVELGSNVGAAKTLKRDASSYARATGGIDGDWYHHANTTVGTGSYVLSPDLPTDAGVSARGDAEDATKITYYTPNFSGFQAGVSFTPDSGNRGTAAGFTTDNDLGQYENVFDLGLNYTQQFNQIGVAASATGQFGDAESNVQEDLRAYALGLDLTFSGFTVGGSWGDWQDSGTLTAVNSDDVQYWTLGGAYVQGPIGASISYLNSERANNDFDIISVGADYQLAPGLVPYAEISFFNIDPAATTTRDNDGTVFLLGTQLTF